MAGQPIETVINSLLKDNARTNALDFIAHLRGYGIPLEESDGYWEIKYRDRCVCFILITGGDEKPGPWTIWSDQEPGTWITWQVDAVHTGTERKVPQVDEQVRKTVFENVNFCASCGGDCSPGTGKTILGQPFDHVCGSALAFTDPDADMLHCAKKMVDARVQDILGCSESVMPT